jgi:hypothetical protein
MMRALILAGLMMGAAAGSAVADCAAKVEVPWTSAKQYGLSLAAYAVGPNCATSAVVLVVLDAKRDVQWSTTRLAHQTLGFTEGITDDASMTAALKIWVEQRKPQSTSELPDWKSGTDRPEREGSGEFGYYTSEGTTRDYYLDTRSKAHPLFCFVQGIESTSCIAAAAPNNIYEIGGFTFPG